MNKQHLQDQFFNFNDGKKASISFPADSLSYQLDQKGTIHKRKMNSVHKLSGEEFKKIDHLFSSSLYVVSQPFQLIKSKAIFKRLQDTVVNRKKVYALDVYYKDDTENSDQWTYYFDQNTFNVIACKVRHQKRVSVIENTSYDMSTPFLFNATRKSTIIHAKERFIIAKYSYSNYNVTFR